MEAREMDLEQALEDFDAAADAFAKGNPPARQGSVHEEKLVARYLGAPSNDEMP